MRRALVAMTAAALMAAVPAPALAQTGSLGSLTGSGSPTGPIEPAPVTAEQRLTEVAEDYLVASGHRLNAEAKRNAEAILRQALAGEFTYTLTTEGPFAGTGAGLVPVRNLDGTAVISRVPVAKVEGFIAAAKAMPVQASGESSPVGVAVGTGDGFTFLVEYTLGG